MTVGIEAKQGGAEIKHDPDEIVAGILYYLDKKKITADPKKIHSGFCNLKKEHKELMRRFVFSKTSVYPYSDLLEKILFRLQQARIIGMINPTYDEYVIDSKGMRGIGKVFIPNFSEEEQKELQEMAKKLSEYLEE